MGDDEKLLHARTAKMKWCCIWEKFKRARNAMQEAFFVHFFFRGIRANYVLDDNFVCRTIEYSVWRLLLFDVDALHLRASEQWTENFRFAGE